MAAFDKEAIRAKLKFAEVLRREYSPELRRSGGGLVCRCPFHEDGTPSFSIRGGESGDHGHCFGCGWQGDIFRLWMESRGVSFPEALKALAALAGVGGCLDNVEWRHRRPAGISEERPVEKPAVKPALPRLRRLRADEVAELAELRGLSVEGVRVAAEVFRRVGACDWPQWQDKCTGAWRVAGDAARSWCVTDDTRRVADFRRLDGAKFVLKRQGEQREIKAWSTAGKSWPVGAAEIGDRPGVLLVEGGPDMLAGYHFLWGYGKLDQVAVVAMLGTGSRMAADALGFFRGKRVRIILHVDEPDEGHGGKVPSWEAAARWQRQLTAAGAAVESFSLAGLTRADGQLVGDLNDLALCDAETLLSEEVTDAFYDWDF